MRVFLDADVARQIPLECAYVLEQDWNGWAVPVAYSWQVAAFVKRWREADPNGTWGDVYERVSDGALVVTRNDSADPDDWDIWPPARFGVHGAPMYELDGWTWVKEES